MGSTAPPAIESVKAHDGSPDDKDSSYNEWSAWAMRRRLPSELAHKTILRYPGDVSDITGLSTQTLKAMRSEGDCPRLYGLGRVLVTTPTDVADWVLQHALQPGQLLRPATIPKGTRRPVKKVAAQKAAA